VKVPLEEMTQFIQRLGDKEPNLAPEFTLTVQGYKTPENNRTSPGLFQYLKTSLYEQNVDEDKNDDGLVTISMFWMGDSNPENPVGMQYIKENVIPLFSNNSTIDNVVYYYFSWSGMSREREQDGSWKSVWSAQSWNGFLLPQNNTQEIWTDIQSSLSAMFKYCKYVTPKVELWGGAISKISSNATAFPHRNAVYNIGIELLVPTENDADAANDEMHLVNAIWPSIARHLDGVYVNYPMASLSNESYPTAYWGKNLKRLKELKQRYDPTYALNVSQSIPIL
jgi:FAD/FMN-containing dehydrogenase